MLLYIVVGLIVAVVVLWHRTAKLLDRVHDLEGKVRPVIASLDAKRRSAALGAIAHEIQSLPTKDGRLSLTMTAQIEEVARMIDNGADETQVRDAMKRIREGETLADTLRRS